MKQANKILQNALVQNNVLAQEDLAKYSAKLNDTEESLKDYLLSQKIVTEKQIFIALSQTLKLPTILLRDLNIEKDVIDRVSVKFAWYYKIMPVRFENNILTIAVAFPIDINTQDEIRRNLNVSIDLVLAQESDLYDTLKKYYGLASDTIDRIMIKQPIKEQTASQENNDWVEDLERKTDDPTVSNLVNQIILEAYKKRATDIHIEPYRNKVRFRYRIDGVLTDANLPANVKHFLPQILSRIKILANLSITEKRLPQDGSAVVKTNDQQLDLRVSTMPTPRGESMVIRILPTKVVLFSLEKLGFGEISREQFRYLIKKPHGIIFMTGPTGSGKTTTLYACLNEINSSKRKIITIEDPVEYEMDGITQVQVNPKVNFHFSTGLRSLLRHDPDIIMVGEVRDLETAEIAIRTALTGHLVFSTLHTNDAASGITRLIDMGVEPYLVASSVESFVAQRLIRVICPECKEEDVNAFDAVKEEMARALRIKNIDDIKIYKGKGCDHCNGTGFYGRVAIYEILIINDAIRAAILEKPRSDYIKRIAMQEGLATLRQNGWQAVLSGITTPDEIINATIKDEEIDIPVKKDEQTAVIAKKEPRSVKIKKQGDWVKNNQYESRIYPRAYEPVKIRYKLMKTDPNNPKVLLSDGIEYTTLSEDVSAGGLRFISKVMLAVDSIIELKFDLQGQQENVNCLAKVCRVEEDSLESVHTIVAYYLDISSTDRAAINRFVRKNLHSGSDQDLSIKIASTIKN